MLDHRNSLVHRPGQRLVPVLIQICAHALAVAVVALANLGVELVVALLGWSRHELPVELLDNTPESSVI